LSFRRPVAPLPTNFSFSALSTFPRPFISLFFLFFSFHASFVARCEKPAILSRAVGMDEEDRSRRLSDSRLSSIPRYSPLNLKKALPRVSPCLGRVMARERWCITYDFRYGYAGPVAGSRTLVTFRFIIMRTRTLKRARTQRKRKDRFEDDRRARARFARLYHFRGNRRRNYARLSTRPQPRCAFSLLAQFVIQ